MKDSESVRYDETTGEVVVSVKVPNQVLEIQDKVVEIKEKISWFKLFFKRLVAWIKSQWA